MIANELPGSDGGKIQGGSSSPENPSLTSVFLVENVNLRRVKRFLERAGNWVKNFLTNNNTAEIPPPPPSIYGTATLEEIRVDFAAYYACMERRKKFFTLNLAKPTKMMHVVMLKTATMTFACEAW